MFAPDRSWDPSSMEQRLKSQQKPRGRRQNAIVTADSSQAVTPRQEGQTGVFSDNREEETAASVAASSYKPIRSRRSWTRNSSSTNRFRTPSPLAPAKHHSSMDVFDTIRTNRTRPVDDLRSHKSSSESAVRRSRSQVRRRDRSPHHRVMGSIEEATGTEPACTFCASNLSHEEGYRCHDCPFLLCTLCIVNVGSTQPRHRSTHRCQKIRLGTELPEPYEASRASTVAHVAAPPSPYTCSFCDQEFPDGGYECEQCTGVYLCETDHDYHIPHHTLRARSSAARPRLGTRGINEKQRQDDDTGNSDEDGHSQGGSSQADDEEEDSCRIVDWRHRDSSVHTERHTKRRRHGTRDLTGADDIGGESDVEAGGTDDDEDEHDRRRNTGDSTETGPKRGRGRPRRSTRSSRSTGSSNFTLSVPMDLAPALRIILEQFGTPSAKKVLKQIPTSKPRASQEDDSRREGTRKKAPHRLWLPEDRERLEYLMQKGRSYAEVAEDLDRTEGAVIQQWRKQA